MSLMCSRIASEVILGSETLSTALALFSCVRALSIMLHYFDTVPTKLELPKSVIVSSFFAICDCAMAGA